MLNGQLDISQDSAIKIVNDSVAPYRCNNLHKIEREITAINGWRNEAVEHRRTGVISLVELEVISEGRARQHGPTRHGDD